MIRVLSGLVLLLALTLAATADELAGRVVGVSDGDTLTLAGPGRRPVIVRLAGIDAPEHDQPFGQRSRRSLAELAFNPSVTQSESAVFAGRCGAKGVGGEMTSCEEARFYNAPV